MTYDPVYAGDPYPVEVRPGVYRPQCAECRHGARYLGVGDDGEYDICDCCIHDWVPKDECDGLPL